MRRAILLRLIPLLGAFSLGLGGVICGAFLMSPDHPRAELVYHLSTVLLFAWTFTYLLGRRRGWW